MEIGREGDGQGRGRVHEREVIYHGFVDLVRLDVTAPEPDGGRHEVVFLDPRPAVVALPLLADGTVLLARQYRPAVDAWVLEAPAGGIDGDESPEQAVHRELREELGLRTGRLEPLGRLLSSPGVSTEELHLFAALDCVRDGAPTGEETIVEEALPSLADALALIERGVLRDAKTQVLVLRLAARSVER